MAIRSRREPSRGTRQRVLVTGGAGLIGSHLVEALLADGEQVTAIDNLSTGSISNIAHLEDERRFDFLVGDITDRGLVNRLVADCDIVFHLAAAVGVDLILSHPIQSFRTNVIGTETILDAAAKHG